MIRLNIDRKFCHPSPDYREGEKVKNFAFKGSGFEREQRIGKPKQTCWVSLLVLCIHQIWYSSVHAPLRTSTDEIAPLNLDCDNVQVLGVQFRQCAKSSITQPRIVRCRSNFIQSLNMWQSMYYKSSRSRSQRSSSQLEKRRLIAKLLLFFRKSGSLNLMAMSQYLSETAK